jgi:hypothetical protein
MAQPPKRPATRRPRSGTATPRRASTRKAASPEAATEAAAKPKRTRATKAAPAPSTAAPATPAAPRRSRGTRKASPAPSPAATKSGKRHDQAEHQARDGHGRFKVSGRARAIALGVGGAVIAVGAGLGTALLRGWIKMPRGPIGRGDGHAAPDLALDAPKPGTGRAPEAFRPDPTAVPTAEERDALRPLGKD